MTLVLETYRMDDSVLQQDVSSYKTVFSLFAYKLGCKNKLKIISLDNITCMIIHLGTQNYGQSVQKFSIFPYCLWYYIQIPLSRYNVH